MVDENEAGVVVAADENSSPAEGTVVEPEAQDIEGLAADELEQDVPQGKPESDGNTPQGQARKSRAEARIQELVGQVKDTKRDFERQFDMAQRQYEARIAAAERRADEAMAQLMKLNTAREEAGLSDAEKAERNFKKGLIDRDINPMVKQLRDEMMAEFRKEMEPLMQHAQQQKFERSLGEASGAVKEKVLAALEQKFVDEKLSEGLKDMVLIRAASRARAGLPADFASSAADVNEILESYHQSRLKTFAAKRAATKTETKEEVEAKLKPQNQQPVRQNPASAGKKPGVAPKTNHISDNDLRKMSMDEQLRYLMTHPDEA